MPIRTPIPAPCLLLAAVLAANLGGCAWIGDWFIGTDNSPPPAPLVEIANPLNPPRAWETSVGDGTGKAFVKLVPAFEQGTLYVAAHDGEVAAVDAASGRTVWKIDTDLAITAGVGAGAGLVLVGTAKGEVVALRTESGAEAWRVRVSSEVLASPRIADGVVVVRSADGRFTGLDATSGRRLWVHASTVPALTLRGSAAPLLGQGVAVAGLENGRVLVLNLRSGQVLAEKALTAPRGRTEMERLVDIDAEPRAAGSVLYLAPYRGAVSALDLQNGALVWTREVSSYAGLDLDPAHVFVSGADDAVYALDRRSGAVLWKQGELGGRKLTAPAAAGRLVAVGDFEGWVHLLDAGSGRIVGRVQVDSAGLAAPPLVRGGTLYAYGKSGKLAAYNFGG